MYTEIIVFIYVCSWGFSDIIEKVEDKNEGQVRGMYVDIDISMMYIYHVYFIFVWCKCQTSSWDLHRYRYRYDVYVTYIPYLHDVYILWKKKLL